MQVGKSNTVQAPSILWVGFSEYRLYQFPCLGLHTIAGHVQAAVPDVKQPLYYYNPDEVCALEDFFKNKTVIDYVALSVNIGFLKEALRVVRLLREIGYSGKLILGNREFSRYEPNKIISIIQIFPEAVICTGDGEETFLEYIKGTNLADIPNLCFLKKEKTELNQNALHFTCEKSFTPTKGITAPVLWNFQKIINADLSLNADVGYMETGRGCSKALATACSFCSNSAISPDLRRVYRKNRESIRHAIKEFLTQAEPPHTINIVDEDLFSCKPDELLEDLEIITGEIPSKLNFYGAIKPGDVVKSGDSARTRQSKYNRLSKMKSLGFNCLYVGFESGSQAALDRYQKQEKVEDYFDVALLLKSLSIHIDGGFIMADPLMKDFEEIRDNINFLRRIDVPKLKLFPFNTLSLYPGTEYAKKYQHQKDMGTININIIRMVETLQYLHTKLPIAKMEQFLQRLRLLYFTSPGRTNTIKQYEGICGKFGELSLTFLEELIAAFERQDQTVRPDELNTKCDDFVATHQKILTDMSVL